MGSGAQGAGAPVPGQEVGAPSGPPPPPAPNPDGWAAPPSAPPGPSTGSWSTGPTTWGGTVPAGGQGQASPPGPPSVPPAAGQAPGAAPVPGPASSRSRLVLLLAAVAVVLVVGVVAVAVVVRGLGGEDAVTVQWLNTPGDDGPTSQPGDEEDFAIDVDCDGACDLTATGDRVVVAEFSTSDDEGSSDAEVMAYTASGDEAWDDATSVDEAYSITGFSGYVAVETSESVVVLDVSNGSEVWSEDGGLSLVTEDGVAVVNEYNYDDDEGESSTVRGIELSSGDELWDVEGYVERCGDLLLAVDGDDLSLIDARSGEERWSERADSPNQTACSDAVVAYVAEGEDEVTVLDGGDGSEVGSIDIPGSDSASVAVFGDDVYVTGDGEVSRNRVGGDIEELWSENGPDEAYLILLAGDTLIVTGDSAVEALAVSDGGSLGRVRGGDDVVDLEITAQSVIFAEDDAIEAYRISDLEDRWSLDVDDASEMAVGADRVFVLADDQVLAFG